MGFWNWLFGSKKKPEKNIQMIVEEIASLSRLQDISRKMELLNHIFPLVQQQSDPELWAVLQAEFGYSLAQNPQGNRAENIEHAIEHYNQALKVFTQQKYFLEYWTRVQNNLAAAYIIRIRGDKADNIEKAIKYCNQALQARTCQEVPVERATAQNNLAIAYVDRIRGERAENIEKAINHCNQALNIFTQNDFPAEWAATQSNLGNAYWSRIKGDKAENIEKAIEHHTMALEMRTQKDFPIEWARTQHNLGSAYIDRIRGERAENIEKAIKHCNQALEIYTQKDFPVEWARTQNSLAHAYEDRIKGNRAENIEHAIENCNQALEIYTQKDFPVEWATAQNTLGSVYIDRIRGEQAENIEHAIEHYNQAFKIFTQKDFPVKWATVQNNLAHAYENRIKGNRAENIEHAIENCNKALKVFLHHDFPEEWCMAHESLAAAYNNRIKGDMAENIEKAIEHHNQALEIYTQKDFPVDWAMVQINLANAYHHRVKGDRTNNIKQAIEHHNEALKIFTQKDFPMEWAITQNNLAGAYGDYILEDRAENIEKAIEHFKNALTVYTQKDFPADWAMVQINLANTYKDRIKGDKAENIERAISHCHNSLKIYKLESMPNSFRMTCGLLGDLYLDKGQWKDALENYKKAIKAGNLLYRSSLFTENKSVEIRENVDLYRNAALAANYLGLVTEALLLLDGGKTCLLSETLRLKMKQPKGVPEDEWIKYEKTVEKYLNATKLFDLKEDYTQKEKEIQKILEELDDVTKIVQKYNPRFQKGLGTSDIQSILDNETALMTFCITDKGSVGFAVSRLNGVQSVEIPDFRTEDLDNLFFKPNEQGFITGGWVGDYLDYLDAVAIKNYKDVFQSWQITFNNVLSSIGTKLLDPLIKKLPFQTKKLIFLPSGGLFLLPLHAVPLFDDKLLCQRYCISYAPSIELLKEMQDKAKTVKGTGLYAVINPEEDTSLVFSRYEGQAISKFFLSPQINVGETSTKTTVLDRVLGRAYIHFSCHGSYDWDDPLQSGLYLVGGRTLSLADLQNDIVDMSSARLVTLSACETGITDIFNGNADEFVGLPAGFMVAGVPCVVGSLWSVPDISTALLMERFYSNHIVRGMDIPKALQEAQLWVRDLTVKQVADNVDNYYLSGKWEGKSKEIIEQYRKHYLDMAKESPDKKPFQHPYYWAAFTVNGA